ncbi:MAG: DUF1294 domain-containing protein [Lachnospiraceae bacterium]|nr:DUF1294 domain-containing protein [Lachnospiraceae bacterium]
MSVVSYIAIYFVIMNLIGFAIMGIDKRKAIKRAWRIPESTLFVIAIIGGSIGTTIGMHVFHHKTRHWYFLYGMPAILLLQIALIVLLMYLPIEFTFF